MGEAIHKDDQLQSKEEIDKYQKDKEQDENEDVRMSSTEKDKLIVDEREFYEDAKDQDQNTNNNDDAVVEENDKERSEVNNDLKQQQQGTNANANVNDQN